MLSVAWRGHHKGISNNMAKGAQQQKHGLLHAEDRILWDAVRRSAIPLHRNEVEMIEIESASDVFARAVGETQLIRAEASPKSTTKAATDTTRLHPFDKPTHRKIAKGRIHIDGRVDLHGLIQSEAYSLLLHFLQSANSRGLRHVLVITGKGTSPGSDGILRQSVPHWLSTPPFRQIVSSFEDAARHHGGHGALYIRLRRIATVTQR
ncbi:Smr/MutS family protein [Bartonella sp. LJL80]